MKVSCIDATAEDRIALQRNIEDVYKSCRSTIGHVPLVKLYPASKAEALINHPPKVFAVGPGFEMEEAYLTCKELKRTHPEVPVLLFIRPESYSLRQLQRFDPVTDEVFQISVDRERLIHKFCIYGTRKTSLQNGKLVSVHGVKGGVGATSMVSAMAHAAQANGQSAIVVDLSAKGSFCIYMGSERWQSPDYKSALINKIVPDESLLDKCITSAPNGIPILLPPADAVTGASVGSKVREMWIRDPEYLDITFSMIDLLKERYDIIFVDLGSVEGVLGFGMIARADAKVLVTSNDPASVHMLGKELAMLSQTPGEGSIFVLTNELIEKGLNKRDIEDFLAINDHFDVTMKLLEPISFDNHGRKWIGTGNSFYTECSKKSQKVFEQMLPIILRSKEDLTREVEPKSLKEGIKSLLGRSKNIPRLKAPLMALPNNTTEESFSELDVDLPATDNLLRPILDAAVDNSEKEEFQPEVGEVVMYSKPMPIEELPEEEKKQVNGFSGY